MDTDTLLSECDRLLEASKKVIANMSQKKALIDMSREKAKECSFNYITRKQVISNITKALETNRHVILRYNAPDEYDDRTAFAKIEIHHIDDNLSVYVAGRPFWSGSEWAMEEINCFLSVEKAFDYIEESFGISEMTNEMKDNEWIWDVDKNMCQCDVCIVPRGFWD